MHASEPMTTSRTEFGAGRSLELLHAPAQGSRAAHPLLLLHGAFAGAWCWEPNFFPYLTEQGFDVYALSLRGHGGSHGRERLSEYGVGDYVDDVEAAVREIGAPPIVIAHSMGGFVAQKYLERARVPGLALLASAPPQGLLASQLQLAFGNPSLFADLNSVLSRGRGSTEGLRKALFANPLPPERLAEFFRRTQRESQRALWDMTLFNLPIVWAMSKPPMLWLAGEKDALFSLDQMRIGARLLGCRFEVVPRIGHALMLDDGWERVAQRLVEWIGEAVR
jgi:non-heme chloroperoxidase